MHLKRLLGLLLCTIFVFTGCKAQNDDLAQLQNTVEALQTQLDALNSANTESAQAQEAVSEAVDAQVTWDEASKTVQITTDAPAVTGPASTLQPWGKDASDFTVGGFTLNKITYGEFKAQYGSQILSEYDEDGMYHSKYVEIKNGTLMFVKFEYDTPDKDMVLYYIDMQGAGVQGPRGIQIGNTVEQALAKFPANIDQSLLGNYPFEGYDTSNDIYLMLDEQDTELYYQAMRVDGDLVFIHYLPDSDFGAFLGITIENNKVSGIQLDYY